MPGAQRGPGDPRRRARAGTPARCGRPSSGMSVGAGGAGQARAARACTRAASRRRRCCTPPRSPTPPARATKIGVKSSAGRHRHGRGERLQGRRGRQALQGPAGPGEVPQDQVGRGRPGGSRRRTPSWSSTAGAGRTSARRSCSPPAATPRRSPGLDIGGRIITSNEAIRLDYVPRSGS